ncbi:MAG: ATP-grasp domain-containing protein [Erysipelotrichaceae bacterium]|nr:ATP-grasp domain-containing protein [Erysipelotrichaceae bacterium]
MNFIFVSPNFPERNYKWVEALRERGVNVLGIGDTPVWNIHDRLKKALTEYYYVWDMNDHGLMDKAVEYYQSKYGKIDFIESNNEWWLAEDARLRERFGVVTGFHPSDMEHIKAKSAMKEYFQKAGVKTMRYLVVAGKQDKEAATEFVKSVGYPVFVKPNIGVGAADSYSLHNQEEFDAFFEKALPEPYIMEEFIDGRIVSFDGVCNDEGDVVFCTTDHFPVAVAEIVNAHEDHMYYDVPFGLKMSDIDQVAFEAAGRAVVKAFGIRKRVFHIEFFVLNSDKPGFAKKGEFVALECNMRAPGGYTVDLIDYANSASVYQIYADIICFNENRQYMGYPKHYSLAVHRRDEYQYVHSDEEVLEKFADSIKMHGRYPDHIAAVMGNRYFFAIFDDFEKGLEFDKFVRLKK